MPSPTKIRKEKPDAKIVFGNSNINSIEEFLYRRFPAELFDALGHEACGLMRMSERQPELATLQEVFWFKRALEKYGYEKPLWAWFEWQYHSTNAGNVSRQEQADMYVRDMLHGLSYNLERICPTSSTAAAHPGRERSTIRSAPSAGWIALPIHGIG